MSGLIKAKKYDWKDSNLANFGSDQEREVKKESAESEPAWEGCWDRLGLKIWRIVNFQVTHWPEEDYGKFYNGDSYIILNTYKEDDSDTLHYDVHFWIGSESTQDEYGTAAYKTVELDTYLDDKAIQHREVENHESDLFISYFKHIHIMKGGADSGFNHVHPTEYMPRLFHFHGIKKDIKVNEVPCSMSRLNSGDVFILDLGLQIYQWNGSGSNKDERIQALVFMQSLKADRGGKCSAETLDEDNTEQDHPFMEALVYDDEDDEHIPDAEEENNQLYKLSDSSGELEFSEVKSGEITKADLQEEDVFVLDTGKQCFVWVGSKASATEKKNGMSYAHRYLQRTLHPFVPVDIIREGSENRAFVSALAA